MPSNSIKPVQGKLKSREAKERLIALATRLGPGARLPTFVKLRESLSISPTTLNGVLQEMEMEKLIERRHGVGIFVSSQLFETAKRQVCLLCDASFFRSAGHSPFWDMLLDETRARVQENELFSFHLVDSWGKWPPLSEELMHSLHTGRVHGMLSVGISKALIQWITEECAPRLPLVSFATKAPWQVEFDTHSMIEMGVAQLLQKGCRRICIWIPVPPLREIELTREFVEEHSEVFRTAMKQQGIFVDETLICTDVLVKQFQGEFTPNISLQEQGYNLAQRIFSSDSIHPDGIIICDDMMTRGAMVAFQKIGIHIGDDVQIASHSNKGSTVLLGYEKDLIRIEFDPFAMVQAMFSMLMALQSGHQPARDVMRITPTVIK